jgi:hypothetical protein
MKKTDKPWTPEEEQWLAENINKLTMPEVCEHLQRNENTVNIKLLRLRIPRRKGGVNKEMVSRNMVIEMLTQRIGDPATFKPTRQFFERTEIMQKRFHQLYRGEKNITVKEYRALAREWNVTLDDAFEMRQLKMDF